MPIKDIQKNSDAELSQLWEELEPRALDIVREAQSVEESVDVSTAAAKALYTKDGGTNDQCTYRASNGQGKTLTCATISVATSPTTPGGFL